MFNHLFNHKAIDAALRDPTGWRGSHAETATFFERDIFRNSGYKITLHRFVAADAFNCFHSHPATAIRCVLRGGYIEEEPDGTKTQINPGFIGLVQPKFTHRIHKLLESESISLWIRTPKTHSINLVGAGWDHMQEVD